MNNKTREYFDDNAKTWISESYDKSSTIAHARLDAVLDLVRLNSPASILDVGCGDGRFLREVNEVKNRAGIDYSKQMIDLANESNPEIRFTQVDLNNEEGLKKLKHIGQYDFITMMGVVHYLDSPSTAIKGIATCCKENANFIISFRNRLLNAKPSSKYFESPINQQNISRIEKEINLWSKAELEGDDLLEKLNLDSGCHQLIHSIRQSGDFEGVTDNRWNPDNLNHWRQFTPLDAIILMDMVGLNVQQVVPLLNQQINANKLSDSDQPAAGEALSECSSFLLRGKCRV